MKSGLITALPGATESFTLEVSDGQIIYIGRSKNVCGSNEANRIILPYPEVSAKHAEVRYQGSKLTITDAGSTNGTTINGVRVSPGKQYTLKSNDMVGIAGHNLLISLPEEIDSGVQLEEPQTEQANTQLQVNLIHATILVADLKHYSGLMEKYAHDPAIVMRAAGRVFAEFNERIEDNKGQLEKIAGDAIMAYWSNKGSPNEAATGAHRACLTAILLQEKTEKLSANAKIWPFAEHPLVFDIALASGPVARGALGKSQGNPALLGDTANLVFRLEKLMPEDECSKIVVDQNTYDLVKEHFNFKYLGEHAIKGRLNLVNVYQLCGART
jgi:class 3 adenylate cyclase